MPSHLTNTFSGFLHDFHTFHLPLKRSISISEKHRCGEEKQENPSPGHSDTPFQRHLAPGGSETEGFVGVACRITRAVWGFSLMIHEMGHWLVAVGATHTTQELQVG